MGQYVIRECIKCEDCNYEVLDGNRCVEKSPRPEEANADEQISSVIGTLQNSVDNTFDGLQVHYKGKKMRKFLCGRIADDGENFIFTPYVGGQIIYNPSLKNLSFCNCR